jgi:mannose-6-phosphate isomerase-like protein (cupin superfamily)
MEPLVSRPGEGAQAELGPATALVKAGAEQTDGRFMLVEATLPPGFEGARPHFHRELHEMFYVLEGTLTVQIGDETTELPAGSFALVPPETMHTFSNPTGETVRVLNMNTPGGFEAFLLEMTELGRAGPPAPEAVAELASLHDVVFP